MLRDLFALGVEHADHGGVGDLRVGQQQGLEFRRGNLVALVLDQFLEAVDDLDDAVAVDGRDVTGVQVTVVVEGVLGGLVVAR